MSNVRITPTGYVVEKYQVRIKLFNEKEIVGYINIAEGNCSRLSEMFTRDTSPFIVLTKCDTGHRVMIVNKAHIVWAVPVD